MLKVYVASSLLNADRVKSIMNRLTSIGLSITYDWTSHGRLYDHEELKKCALNEMNGVNECDIFLMIHPARNGSHFEFGLAYAQNKPCVIIEDQDVEQKSFYYLPNLNKFSSEDKAFAFLTNFIESHKLAAQSKSFSFFN